MEIFRKWLTKWVGISDSHTVLSLQLINRLTSCPFSNAQRRELEWGDHLEKLICLLQVMLTVANPTVCNQYAKGEFPVTHTGCKQLVLQWDAQKHGLDADLKFNQLTNVSIELCKRQQGVKWRWNMNLHKIWAALWPETHWYYFLVLTIKKGCIYELSWRES